MKKEEKKVKKKRISIFTLVIVVLVIIGVATFLILQKNNIRMNSLIKRDNIIASRSVTSGEGRIDIYPSNVHEKYINITSDGILYVMEDNGYNVDDKNWKRTLISEQTIGTSNLEILKFEMNNLMSVSPEDKINDGANVNYIELTLNGNTKTVYEKDFYNTLQRYNIYIEGEDYESL